MGVSARLRWTAVCCSVLLAAACSDDDGASDGYAGSTPVQGDGGPKTAGRSGSDTGTSGSRAGSGRSRRQRWQPPAPKARHGRAGGGADAGRCGGAGDAGADATTADAAVDSGTDGGDPPSMPTVCKAPAAATNAGNECPTADPAPLELELVHDGMAIPVLVTHAPGDDTRLFVVERNGKIHHPRCRRTGEPIEEFMDLSGHDHRRIHVEQQRRTRPARPRLPSGLSEDPRFFVGLYGDDDDARRTARSERVSSFEVSAADQNKADPASEQELSRIDSLAVEPQRRHARVRSRRLPVLWHG